VGDYEKEGILPEAMFNFLAFLGWSPGDDREVLTRQELVEAFSLERVLKKSAVFDVEKLRWLNGQHLMRTPTEELLPRVEGRLRQDGVLAARAAPGVESVGHAGADDEPGPIDLPALLELLKPRSRTVEELVAQARPYFLDELAYDPDAVRKHWLKDRDETLGRLERLSERLSAVEWEPEALEGAVRGLAEELGVGAGKVIHPLRVALTGVAASPGIFDLLALLGRARTLQRIQRALSLLVSGKPLDS
jgi:glutamyl/glutaminyl-tRNA synthetase